MTSHDLTTEKLREVLFYDPETGFFIWKKKLSERSIVGNRAGFKVNGYRGIGLFGSRLYEHRLAFLYMNGEFPYFVVDHKNGIRSDNRWCNLRDVQQSDNCHNLKKSHKDNKSGYLGVYYCKIMKRFRASICSEGKREVIGYYDCAEDAHDAYINRKRQIHGGCLI